METKEPRHRVKIDLAGSGRGSKACIPIGNEFAHVEPSIDFIQKFQLIPLHMNDASRLPVMGLVDDR